MSKKVILAVLLLTGIAAGASAQTIYGNNRNENYRVAEGARHGSLTRGEQRQLNREQRDIHQDIRRARMNDGYISRRERRHIRQEQRRMNRHIYHAKHNPHYRY